MYFKFLKLCINYKTIKFSDLYLYRVEEQCRHLGGKLWMTDSWQPDTAWQDRGWPRRSARRPQRKLLDQRRNISTVSVINITRLWLTSHFFRSAAMYKWTKRVDPNSGKPADWEDTESQLGGRLQESYYDTSPYVLWKWSKLLFISLPF